MLRAMTTSKRSPGRAKAPAESAEHVPDLMVRGLSAADIAALEAETARRTAALPVGAKLSRNAVSVALLREALAATAHLRSITYRGDAIVAARTRVMVGGRWQEARAVGAEEVCDG